MSDRLRDDAHSLVARLYDSHGAALYRYALLLLADPAGAEDVVHQVFSAILRRPPRIVDEEHYLRRAVRNQCYSLLRQRRRYVETIHASALMEPIVGGVGPEEQIALEDAIRELSVEQREVIYLHSFQGLTFQEIAESTETSINTVAGRYRNALAKLRRMLSGS